MKKNSESLMSKYSDGSLASKKETYSGRMPHSTKMPAMVNYEQRYKGMCKELTKQAEPETLSAKIERKNRKPALPVQTGTDRVPVEIAGTRYLLGCTDEMSPVRIKRIAALVNSILSDAKEENPGLTNSKVTTLALLDACDKLLEARDELSNMKTENMYLQQKLKLEHDNDKTDPTPMEKLALENENE